MGVKKANVNLLLGKVRASLDSVPKEKRKGKKYVEGKKALTRLGKVFAGSKGEVHVVACKAKNRILD